MNFFDKFKLAATIVFVFFGSSAHAIDRTALAEAAFRVYCPLLNYVAMSVDDKHELSPHREVLKDLIQLCESGAVKLEFVPNFDGYEFVNVENNRFMGTGFDRTSPILASQQMLNRTEFAGPGIKPLNLLLKTIAHEFMNKLRSLKDQQGTKDLIARNFAAALNGFETKTSGEGLNAIVFSIPVAKIDKGYANVGSDEIQPALVILVEKNDSYTDLSSLVLNKINSVVPSLRTTYTEANRLATLMLEGVTQHFATQGPQIMAQLRAQLELQIAQVQAQARAQGRDAGLRFPEDDFNKMANLFDQLRRLVSSAGGLETRVVDVHSVHIESWLNNQPSLLIKAAFSMNRGGKAEAAKLMKQLGPNFSVTDNEGLSEKQTIEVPLILRIPLKNAGLAVESDGDIHLDVRPEMSYIDIAKVGQISRSGADVRVVKVKAAYHRQPRAAELYVKTKDGHVMVSASSMSQVSAGNYSFEFQIPENLSASTTDLWTDSVLIDQVQGRMLDRLVMLSEGAPLSAATAKTGQSEQSKIISPGVVARDWSGQPAVLTEFHPFTPLLMLNRPWLDLLLQGGAAEQKEMQSSHWLHNDEFELRFGLLGAPKVREVRLQMSRDVGAGPRQQETDGKIFGGKVEIDGHTIPTWTQVDIKKQQNFYETITFKGEDLKMRETGEKTVVIARKSLRFHAIDDALGVGEGYGPPMLRPLKIEVVLEDFSTLTYEFATKDMGNCEDIIRDSAKFTSHFETNVRAGN